MRPLSLAFGVLSLQFAPCLVAATHSHEQQPWKDYIYSPASRRVKPTAIHSISNPVVVRNLEDGDRSISMAPGGQISLDFGVEVGGWISLTAITSGTSADGNDTPHFSLAYAESPAFVRSISDDTGAVHTLDYDQALNVSIDSSGSTFYTVPLERFRGGFRFLTIRSYENIEISNITCEIEFAPGVEDLRDWSGYFYTPDDELLVRAWYAGAYTIQTNIASQYTGRWLPQVEDGWAYNATLSVAAPVLLDGAKRDRAVWPGDLGIQSTSAFVAFGEYGLSSVHGALETVFVYQNKTTGRFPYAGPSTGSFNHGSESDVYHAWSLVAIYNYAIFTGDTEWLSKYWSNITFGIDFILNCIDEESGLHNQTEDSDWARLGGGGFNSALNALDYHALVSFASLAQEWTDDAAIHNQAATWTAAASRLKASFNTVLWSADQSLYADNETTNFPPQDGNALALLYNLTESKEQASSLSAALTQNWTPIGPITPELPDTISPFVTSNELLAHYAAGEPERALELTHGLWSYLLDSPLMTGSTLAEGITANGSLYYRGNRGYRHDAAYTSLAHGWSSGPTQALSFKVAGLEIVSWKRWIFRPQPAASLKEVKSGYESPMGRFEVSWKVLEGHRNSGRFGFEATFSTAPGTLGSVQLPWDCEHAFLDGRRLSEGHEVSGGRHKKLKAWSCS